MDCPASSTGDRRTTFPVPALTSAEVPASIPCAYRVLAEDEILLKG